MLKRLAVISCVVFALVAAAASAVPAVRDEARWLLTGSTVRGAQAYLADWPNGGHAAEARHRVAEAQRKVDEGAWSTALATNTVEGFEAYLLGYKKGAHITDAALRIEDLHWDSANQGNTYASIQAYIERYPTGRHAVEARSRQSDLLVDDAPYEEALRLGTRSSLQTFLSDFPGHAREASARLALKDAEGRDIADLVAEKKLEVKTQGDGIERLSLEVRSLVSYELTIRVPVGTFFEARGAGVQNMVTTAEQSIYLPAMGTQMVVIDVACANRPLDIPSEDDTFFIRRSPAQQLLAKLMPALEQAGAPFAVRQAAVWIVTDDADYDELGILVSRMEGLSFGGSRVINAEETAEALRILDQAGIDIKRRRIWRDRSTIMANLEDGDLKTWVAER